MGGTRSGCILKLFLHRGFKDAEGAAVHLHTFKATFPVPAIDGGAGNGQEAGHISGSEQGFECHDETTLGQMRRNNKNMCHKWRMAMSKEKSHLKVFLIPINEMLALRILALNRTEAESIALQLANKATERILKAVDNLGLKGPQEIP